MASRRTTLFESNVKELTRRACELGVFFLGRAAGVREDCEMKGGREEESGPLEPLCSYTLLQAVRRNGAFWGRPRFDSELRSSADF
jgi:hypothetical protein